MAKKRHALSFRNRRGERLDLMTFPATTAKNEFGRMLERAISDGAVAITRHDEPRAVLLSYDEFEALTERKPDDLDLETLRAEFDAQQARMQAPGQRAAMQAAFSATPEELGKAAVKAARRRG